MDPSGLTKPMHFFNMLHTLKSLLENIGAGSEVLQRSDREAGTYSDGTTAALGQSETTRLH